MTCSDDLGANLRSIMPWLLILCLKMSSPKSASKVTKTRSREFAAFSTASSLIAVAMVLVETMSTPFSVRAFTTLLDMFSSARSFTVMGIPSLP